MKVLVVNSILYTSETADVKRVKSIKDTMIYDLCLAFAEAGHDTTLFAGEPYKPSLDESYPFRVEWAKCVWPKIFKPNLLPFCPALRGLVRREHFDLVLSSEVFSLNSLMLVRRCKGNLVIWQELAKHNRLLKKMPSRFWYGVVARLFFSGVPVVARSREAQAFISRYCRNVKNTIVDHGVNLGKFACSAEKEDYFVVSSQLIERKRIDKILEKFAKFAERHPRYKLHVFGEGEKEAELKALAERLGIRENAVFHGKVAHDTLREYLGKARAMLVYTRKDNNMVSIVEALACATPVVTTGIPYNASYIRANALGIVDDAWDENDLEEICRNGGKYVANCMAYRETLSTANRVESFVKLLRGQLP